MSSRILSVATKKHRRHKNQRKIFMLLVLLCGFKSDQVEEPEACTFGLEIPSFFMRERSVLE